MTSARLTLRTMATKTMIHAVTATHSQLDPDRLDDRKPVGLPQVDSGNGIHAEREDHAPQRRHVDERHLRTKWRHTPAATSTGMSQVAKAQKTTDNPAISPRVASTIGAESISTIRPWRRR